MGKHGDCACRDNRSGFPATLANDEHRRAGVLGKGAVGRWPMGHAVWARVELSESDLVGRSGPLRNKDSYFFKTNF
jgi:hypothetical protein